MQQSWTRYYKSLNSAQILLVSRNVNPGNTSLLVDIHVFCDASERAYGACVYVCSQNQDGRVSVHLMCSKSRVAPLKSVTLPRLELNAAHLAAKLFNSIERTLSNKIKTVRFWTDSTIVLGWIKTSPHKLQTYVANRVSNIQELTTGKNWHHVSSSNNPADLLSRGINTEELKDNQLWWHGPPWLKNPKEWPPQGIYDLEEVPELRKEVILTVVSDQYDILQNYSSLNKLKRIIAYCMRFANVRKLKRTGVLTVEELEQASIIVVRLVQQQTFRREIENLKKGKEIHRTSNLLPLRPFLDEHGLLRVGGRIRHADVNLDQRHPWLLPSKHHITILVFRDEHKRLLHCEPEQFLSSVRLRYWPLAGRQEARKVTRHCVECLDLSLNL